MMKSLNVLTCLAVAGLGFAAAADRCEAQVTSVAKQIPFSEKEYWEDQRFGADEFWQDYAGWYNRRLKVSAYNARDPVYGARPYYDRQAVAAYDNPRLRAYYNPRLAPYVDPRIAPYPVRPVAPYVAYDPRLLEENDAFVPDSFEPMDEDVSRWPAHYRDYHDQYTDGDYRRSGYFWPASGMGVHPYRYWR